MKILNLIYNLVFAIQWPGSFNFPLVYFTIHGLWPDQEFCSNTKFNINNIYENDLKQMKKVWVSMVEPYDNKIFWEHEYTKHGSCFEMSQKDYFHYTLQLRSLYDPVITMMSKGLIGRNNYYFNVYNAIEEDLSDKNLMTKFEMICIKETYEDYQKLIEIRYSLSNNSINIPLNESFVCNRDIISIPFIK